MTKKKTNPAKLTDKQWLATMADEFDEVHRIALGPGASVITIEDSCAREIAARLREISAKIQDGGCNAEKEN